MDSPRAAHPANMADGDHRGAGILAGKHSMTWSREQLTEAANKRKAAREPLSSLEQAALAYARMEGLTAEEDVDRTKAKAELDQLLAKLKPEAWRGLEDLVGKTDNRVLKGLMHYSLERWQQELEAQRREIDALPGETAPKSRRKRRDRER